MDDLEQLKSLLFGAEKQALDTITERVQRPETRAVDVADVLPEALRLSHQQGDELVENLREPVGTCIRDSVRDEPGQYADALYPVMGPAIRKSIMSALRSFAQQISDSVEQSLSTKGLKWRFEAWRAGIPFGEYVVQRTLQYRVEQAYLISRENGLLIAHTHHEASRIKDSDAVSAMFTAIQDFIKESFTPDRSGRLETADMGEFTLWAVHGPHALLVCVIRGVPPRGLRADLSAILERIHFRYGDAMRDYSGDTATMPGVEEDLQQCLRFSARKAAESERRWSPTFILLVVLLLAALAYFAYQNLALSRQQAALRQAFESTPGFYVTDIDRDGGQFIVRGLADPLAESAEAVATRAGLEADRVTPAFSPFQSLDPDIVIQRARDRLKVPAGVTVEADGTGLRLAGTATEAWLDSARQLVASGMLGVDVDLSGVRSSDLDALLERATRLANGDFFFTDGAVLRDDDVPRLSEYARQLAELARDADEFDIDWAITVVGVTDAPGSLSFNETLAAERASFAATELERQGIEALRIRLSSDVDQGEFETPNPERRRVSISFEMGEAATGDQAPE